jgi:hypothetical protein
MIAQGCQPLVLMLAIRPAGDVERMDTLGGLLEGNAARYLLLAGSNGVDTATDQRLRLLRCLPRLPQGHRPDRATRKIAPLVVQSISQLPVAPTCRINIQRQAIAIGIATRCRQTLDALCRKLSHHRSHQRRKAWRDNVDQYEAADRRILQSPTATSIPNEAVWGRARQGRWRKRWDSNPRRAFTLAGFQDRFLKPLGHSSASGAIAALAPTAQPQSWQAAASCAINAA